MSDEMGEIFAEVRDILRQARTDRTPPEPTRLIEELEQQLAELSPTMERLIGRLRGEGHDKALLDLHELALLFSIGMAKTSLIVAKQIEAQRALIDQQQAAIERIRRQLAGEQ